MINHEPAKTYIGQCIYCRVLPTPEDPLEDEHIVAFAIEGKDVLEKASCRRCAQKTSAVESRAIEQDMRGIRTVLDFPTRHRRKRSITLPVEIVRSNGEVAEIEVPLDEYPQMFAFPNFPPPAYISRAEYHGGIEVTEIQRIQANRNLDSIAAKYDAREMAVYGLKYYKDWARMLAKIAYAFAVRAKGLDRISAKYAYVLNAILGVADDVGMWVGCDDQNKLPQFQSIDHMCSLYVENGELHARVKLFSFPQAPEYHVVVGKLS